MYFSSSRFTLKIQHSCNRALFSHRSRSQIFTHLLVRLLSVRRDESKDLDKCCLRNPCFLCTDLVSLYIFVAGYFHRNKARYVLHPKQTRFRWLYQTQITSIFTRYIFDTRYMIEMNDNGVKDCFWSWLQLHRCIITVYSFFY